MEPIEQTVERLSAENEILHTTVEQLNTLLKNNGINGQAIIDQSNEAIANIGIKAVDEDETAGDQEDSQE